MIVPKTPYYEKFVSSACRSRRKKSVCSVASRLDGEREKPEETRKGEEVSFFFAKSGIGERRPRRGFRGRRGSVRVVFRRTLCPLMRCSVASTSDCGKEGWMAEVREVIQRAVRAVRVPERRVFERADRGSGTPARRGRVEGVAGDAARA